MKISKIITMIDDYICEPNSINAEWVEALVQIRRILLDITEAESK